VRLVNHFSTADAGEQIFVPARKPNYFVGKDRSTNQNLVVVEEQAIDSYQDGFGEQAPGALRNFVCRDGTQVHKRSGEIPSMIENASLAALSVDHGLAHQPRELRVTHQRVRAESHQVVASGRPRTNLLLQKLEHQRHRHRARAIGDDGQHALAVHMKFRACLSNHLANFIVSQQAVSDTLAQDHGLSPVL
jgi:hypothetical protein